MMKKEYYELQWYDNNYSGDWRLNNRFKTIEEAHAYVERNKSMFRNGFRIVYKAEEVIETWNCK